MRVSRRSFCGCGFACGLGLGLPAAGWAQTDEADDVGVLCGTDESALQGQFQITDFAASEALEIQTGIREFKITDYGTAMAANRWRRKDGLTPNTGVITLGCFLMSGTAAQQDLVRESAAGWLRDGIEQKIRFDFTVSQQKSQIRVLIGGRGNNSKIGRDALKVPVAEQTMNLVNINRGTIQHEFGHALGLLHEHMHPGFNAPLDADAVIAAMAKPPNAWDEATTQRNILTRLDSQAQCVGDPQFNASSIMMYNIPPEWTRDRSSFKRADRIHQRDINCVRGLYGVGA